MFILYKFGGSFFYPSSYGIGRFSTANEACEKALQLGAEYVIDDGFPGYFKARSMDEKTVFAIRPHA
jgi:hypothetical protein